MPASGLGVVPQLAADQPSGASSRSVSSAAIARSSSCRRQHGREVYRFREKRTVEDTDGVTDSGWAQKLAHVLLGCGILRADNGKVSAPVDD